MNEELIDQLIDNFLKEAEYTANCFYKKYNRKDLLRAVIDGTITRTGKIDGLKHYAFHGIGLYARLKNCEVDFDFGLGDRIDGFDSWRLNQFAQSRTDKKKLWTQEKIQNGLEKLKQTGEISKLKGDISSNYYKH